MKFNNTILLTAFFSLLLLSCNSDPLAKSVYKKEQVTQEKIPYSLSIIVKGNKDLKNAYVSVGRESLFDSKGNALSFSKEKFLFLQSLEDNKTEFKDLESYKNERLFFNVLKKEGDNYLIMTNTGSQLVYQPVFGNQGKQIDLTASPEPFVKQSTLNIQIPQVYLGKQLYIVPKQYASNFESKVLNGEDINSDIFVKLETKSTSIFFDIVTPMKEKEYNVYLLHPNSELPYISKEFVLDNSGKDIVVTIYEELKKTINIKIIRGDKPFDKAEVFIIDANNWGKVDEQISKNHGSPEKGTYLSKKIANGGIVEFQMYQTQGERKLIILVPKWNREYYDSYEKREITINSKTSSYNLDIVSDFNPSTGGSNEFGEREMTFDISVQKPQGYNYFWSKDCYLVLDSDNLSKVWNAIIGGGDPSDMAINGAIDNEDKAVLFGKIDTSKEVAIIVPVMKGFSFEALVKRVNIRSIEGNSISITVSDFENIQ